MLLLLLLEFCRNCFSGLFIRFCNKLSNLFSYSIHPSYRFFYLSHSINPICTQIIFLFTPPTLHHATPSTPQTCPHLTHLPRQLPTFQHNLPFHPSHFLTPQLYLFFHTSTQQPTQPPTSTSNHHITKSTTLLTPNPHINQNHYPQTKPHQPPPHNRDSEDSFIKDRDEKKDGAEWERACAMCDFNPKVP